MGWRERVVDGAEKQLSCELWNSPQEAIRVVDRFILDFSAQIGMSSTYELREARQREMTYSRLIREIVGLIEAGSGRNTKSKIKTCMVEELLLQSAHSRDGRPQQGGPGDGGYPAGRASRKEHNFQGFSAEPDFTVINPAQATEYSKWGKRTAFERYNVPTATKSDRPPIANRGVEIQQGVVEGQEPHGMRYKKPLSVDPAQRCQKSGAWYNARYTLRYKGVEHWQKQVFGWKKRLSKNWLTWRTRTIVEIKRLRLRRPSNNTMLGSSGKFWVGSSSGSLGRFTASNAMRASMCMGSYPWINPGVWSGASIVRSALAETGQEPGLSVCGQTRSDAETLDRQPGQTLLPVRETNVSRSAQRLASGVSSSGTHGFDNSTHGFDNNTYRNHKRTTFS